MHITHLAHYNLLDVRVHSGTPYWISKSLMEANIPLYNWGMSEAQKMFSPWQELMLRCKQWWAQFSGGGYIDRDWSIVQAQHCAKILQQSLKNHKTNVILTSIDPACGAFLETSIPMVHWGDATYQSLACFYPFFRNQHRDTNWDGYFLSNACYSNARLLIFSSQWAARSVIELYGITKDKVKVIPFGANMEISHTLSDVKAMVRSRDRACIKFLFIGKEWYRKGGDIVLQVAKALHKAGYPVEVTCVGATPNDKNLPDYVKVEGHLLKNNAAHVQRLRQLYQEAHFLFVPSRAECYGIVFAEANAFGVPCLTTYIGGITEAVKDHINGMTFSLEASIENYCHYIINLVTSCKDYEALALSSFYEYQTRLNWQTAVQQLKKYIELFR